MGADAPAADVDDLVRRLRDDIGGSLRSVVEYTPESNAIHYLRDDIDEMTARHRLARVGELYHSERLSAGSLRSDPNFGTLDAAVYFFGAARVVHVVEPAGVVYGVSVDHDVETSVTDLVRACFIGLYGSVPAHLDGNDG